MVSIISVGGLVFTGSCFTCFQHCLNISVSVSTGITEQLDSKISVTPYSLVKLNDFSEEDTACIFKIGKCVLF
jgi:hypothetical protein